MFYAAEILLGLEYMHKKGIINRDVKPENVLLDDYGHVKIADFGLAKENPEDILALSFCGSPEYMAPEVIRKEGHTQAVDFYCMGILIYELVVGVPPFSHPDATEIYKLTLSSKITFPKDLRLSNACKDLILGLTNKDCEERLGARGGVERVLEHKWFSKLNIDDLRTAKLDPPCRFVES